jgi:hypothetical protein
MHDRVVDRAAALGEPADLAVRDWLLVGLSFSAGMYEAICFLTFGKVFAGFQTGNLVLLGVGVAGTAPPAGPNAVTVVISLAAFAAGVALAMPILKAFGGGQKTGHNAVRSLNVPGISTTAFTATFVGLVSGLVTRALAAPAAWRLTATMVGLAAGAFLGDWMLSHAHAYAPVVPAVVTAVVIAIAWVALKPQATSGAAGYGSGTIPCAPRGNVARVSSGMFRCAETSLGGRWLSQLASETSS